MAIATMRGPATMLAHAVLIDAGVTDCGLVVKSTRQSAEGDGITARNLRDSCRGLVEAVQSASWPENRLVQPE